MLLEHLASQIASHPHHAAVVAGDETISYAELDRRSATVASLVLLRNPAVDTLVAIYLDRCTDLIAAIVGVMRAGCAYTIVEGSEHSDEHRHRLKMIGADWIITDSERAQPLRNHGLAVIELTPDMGGPVHAPPLVTPAASSLAYVLFTSGSTGVPKGVEITHANIDHYVISLLERLGIKEALSYAHVSTLAADLGNTCLLLSLWTGGRLHLIGETLRKDPAGLLDYLARHSINLLKITPSHWRAVLQALGARRESAIRLRYLVLGGEILPLALARETLRAHVADILVNHYGPTETTVGIATFALRSEAEVDELQTHTVPVGWPLGTTRALVRDADGHFHVRDATGELYVGGPSVGRGYFRNPQATAASFATDVEEGARFYRTGDRVRVLSSGAIEVLGRNDRQVKVNGYRIELEHVENALRVAGCLEAAAYVFELHGKPAIVAAVNVGEGEDSLAGIRKRLESTLPGYMLPKLFEAFSAFPRNENGKTDLKSLQALLAARVRDLSERNESQPDQLEEPASEFTRVVREAWKRCLGHARFGDDESFFAAGGDSLDAIQLIAGLQAEGCQVSAHVFLQEPSVRALAAQLTMAPVKRDESPNRARGVQVLQGEQFTGIQRWFFAQNFADADHYNQAILLECARPLAFDLLGRAVHRLCEWHPLLTVRYRRNGDRWVAQSDSTAVKALPLIGTSAIDAAQDDESAGDQIRAMAQALQAWLSLDAGRVFAVHLFTRDQGPQQLLLVGHHLSVDIISWRVMLNDLVRLYEIYAHGDSEPPVPAGTALWDWASSLGARKEEFEADLSYWRRLPQKSLQRYLGGGDPTNTEQRAQTAWIAFSKEQTAVLQETLPGVLRSPFHHILLATFICALRQRAVVAESDLLVEIESHGRLSFDKQIDISRAVGWFTSCYPVLFALEGGELADYVGHIEAVLSAVPRLGLAYGLHAEALANEWGGLPVPLLSYNYLGEFQAVRGKQLNLAYSRHSPGIARGGGNRRGAELKLTARVIDGQLFADLCFDARRYSVDAVEAIWNSVREQLLRAGGLEDAQPASIVWEQGSSSGQVAYAPSALRRYFEQRTQRRRYGEVLLTGASGYLGIFALRELLTQTSAHVHCLVRERQGIECAVRLADIFAWYFPDTPLATWQGRYTVVAGDVGRERLGLHPAAYQRLSARLDAIYHFAADTRLFCPDARGQYLQNVEGTRHVLELARDLRLKDVHYMSTLAVCGINTSGRPMRFAEHALDIGQEFQNDYERSKFEAERLVNEFAAQGGTSFIYRSGNVSADSSTGRFQRNGGDNRLVQLLTAVIKLGRLPRRADENIVLSPVDLVVRGVVAVSLDASVQGGVFHVDSPCEIPLQSLFTELAGLGVNFERTSCEGFIELFQTSRRLHDRDISLGYFWVRRKPRNVIFDNTRTLNLLKGHGVVFPKPNPTWVRAFLAHLIDSGVLQRRVREQVLAAAGNGLDPESVEDDVSGQTSNDPEWSPVLAEQGGHRYGVVPAS